MLANIILETLRYFDVQDHALNLVEIAKYLPANSFDGGDDGLNTNVPIADIAAALQDNLSGQVGQKNGFYFLKGREHLAENRLYNNFYASARLRRIKKYLPLVRHVPFISAVALSGSEAISNSKKGSDIDLLVLTNKGRMWLGRLALTFYFQMLGMRRHSTFIENRFCLNHYIEHGKILTGDKNLYTAVEYVSLVPFFGGKEIFEFQQANLGWIRNYLRQPKITEYPTAAPSKFKLVIENLFSSGLGDLLEKICGRMQLSKIKIQEYITVEKDELSFHPGSKGQHVLAKLK